MPRRLDGKADSCSVAEVGKVGNRQVRRGDDDDACLGMGGCCWTVVTKGEGDASDLNRCIQAVHLGQQCSRSGDWYRRGKCIRSGIVFTRSVSVVVVVVVLFAFFFLFLQCSWREYWDRGTYVCLYVYLFVCPPVVVFSSLFLNLYF